MADGSELGVELGSPLGLDDVSELGVELGSELGVAEGGGLVGGSCSGGGGTAQVSAAFLAASMCSATDVELPP